MLSLKSNLVESEAFNFKLRTAVMSYSGAGILQNISTALLIFPICSSISPADFKSPSSSAVYACFHTRDHVATETVFVSLSFHTEEFRSALTESLSRPRCIPRLYPLFRHASSQSF